MKKTTTKKLSERLNKSSITIIGGFDVKAKMEVRMFDNNFEKLNNQNIFIKK